MIPFWAPTRYEKIRICTSMWEMDLLPFLLRSRPEILSFQRLGRTPYWHLTLGDKTPQWTSYFRELTLLTKYKIINRREQTTETDLALDRFLLTSVILWSFVFFDAILAMYIRCHISKHCDLHQLVFLRYGVLCQFMSWFSSDFQKCAIGQIR